MKNILILLAGLFAAGALLIAFAALFRQTKKHSINDLLHAYLSEILIIAVVLLPAWAGELYFLLVLLIFLLLTHREVAQSTGMDMSPVFLCSYLYTALLLAGYHTGLLEIYEVQFLYLLAAIAMVLSAGFTDKQVRNATGLLLITCMAASCLLYILRQPDGFVLLLMLYVITETNDSFAYLTGKLFGRIRPFPVISPNKTVEGLAGGVLAALLAGGLFNYFILHNPWTQQLAVICACIGGAIAGDLIFSSYKRNRGIKDFSEMIKKQGGVLDIYDSLLTASVVYYLLLL